MHSTTYISDTRQRFTVRVLDLGGVPVRMWRAYARRVRRRATERTLAGLSDQTLRDIGLHRSEISSVARQVSDDQNRRRS